MKRWPLVLLAAALGLFLSGCGGDETPVMPEDPNENVQTYLEKAALLREQAVTDDILWELGDAPAGEPGHAVFFSVCDGTTRASVYHGTGADLSSAWDAAVTSAAAALQKSGLEPEWVKADVVYVSETVPTQELTRAVCSSRPQFFRYGAAFDSAYQTALLEAELNGAEIYDYGDSGVNLKTLKRYLKEAGQKTLRSLPEQVTLFRTFGWFCDENSQVYALDSRDLSFGRRKTDLIDGAYARTLSASAAEFLMEQVREDGSFVYGVYPCADEEIEGGNIVRHAGAVWSLLLQYRLDPQEELAETIDRTIDYLLSQVLYEDAETAYLYEESVDEIKLGGSGMAVIALTEYMDVFQTDQYREVCRSLGNGILKLLDQETGAYYHVLNGDFSRKEAFRTAYYDGEATFALCRLYGLTGEDAWLTAARAAVERFMQTEQELDHWAAYSMNELTKYVTDDERYYAYALRGVQSRLEELAQENAASPTSLELLMSTFELYDRMLRSGASVEGFQTEEFLTAIYEQAERMLNGFFYPEFAMYMARPESVLGTFMTRQEQFRVRIDDVQHNISGYYLYAKNFDRLTAYGMLAYRS